MGLGREACHVADRAHDLGGQYGTYTEDPGEGGAIGLHLGLYGLYQAIVGIREMHSTTTGRAALVVLVPIGLFLVAVGLVAGAFFLGRLT